jgi:hypothetical protein
MEPLWPERPYKGLARYSVEDAALFVGREEEVERCAKRLEDSELQLSILHGLSGTGNLLCCRQEFHLTLQKIPRSRLSVTGLEGSAEQTGIVIRAGSAPLKAIARRVWELTGAMLMKWSGPEESPEILQSARLGIMSCEDFIEKAGVSAEEMLRATERLSRAANSRLLLGVDQAEEVFLSADRHTSERKEINNFLQKFCNYSYGMNLLMGDAQRFQGQVRGRIEFAKLIRPRLVAIT